MENRRDFLRLAVLFEGGMLLVAMLLRWLLSTTQAAPVVWNLPDFLWGLAGVVPLLAFYFLGEDLRELLHNLIGKALRECTILDLAIVALLAGVSEELCFRGLLEPLVARWNPMIAVIGISLLFGALHSLSMKYFLLTVLIGGYFSWMTFGWGTPTPLLSSPNLLRPIVAHSVYDFVALMLLARESRRLMTLRTESTGQDSIITNDLITESDASNTEHA